MIKHIDAIGAPSTKGYPLSHAVVSNNLVYTSGQIYLTAEGKLLEGTIEEKTHQVMKNLQAILLAAGSSFESVLKTTIYVTDMEIYGKLNTVYASYFSKNYPAREVICVKSLPLGAEIEISLVASVEAL
ncbi:Rid family detoxifying hydrolase [Candidatus Woesebacteria bacterium]|nr:Rid family detoxifying hydrolase [Candidatus Woesebacteria bacterium]